MFSVLGGPSVRSEYAGRQNDAFVVLQNRIWRLLFILRLNVKHTLQQFA